MYNMKDCNNCSNRDCNGKLGTLGDFGVQEFCGFFEPIDRTRCGVFLEEQDKETVNQVLAAHSLRKLDTKQYPGFRLRIV